jgi:hypothetical protein
VEAADDDLMVDALVESGKLTQVRWQRLPDGYLPTDMVSRLSASQVGEYEVRLLDGTGDVLASKEIGAQPIAGARHDGALLNTVMPFKTGTEEVQILESGSVLSRTAVSAHTPTVEVESPNGGETVGDELEVSWTADDADGDELVHSVEYSPDGGDTWLLLEGRTTATVLAVDTENLPGSDGASLIRVQTSDGINVAMDESDGPFSVPRKAPDALITRPEPPAFLNAGRPVSPEGLGTDLEDGFLQGDALRWYVEGRGEVGTGQEVYLPDLQEGCHTLRLEVTDSDGQTDTDTRIVCLGVEPKRFYLPAVLRRVGS